MTAILIVLSCGFYQIKKVSIWLFVVLYALTFFFANVSASWPLSPWLQHSARAGFCLYTRCPVLVTLGDWPALAQPLCL